MTERRAVTLALMALALISMAACGAVIALGGGDELAALAMILVLGVGVDQISKLIMSFDRS